MAIHSGKSLEQGDVCIGAPTSEFQCLFSVGACARHEDSHWFNRAEHSDSIYYFAIYWRQVPVGQILLHDIDWDNRESLIGYRLFELCHRGKGMGTRALGLLQQFVAEYTDLKACVIITSRDNRASQRIAQKCGFGYVGPAREDPVNGVVYRWNVPVQTEE